MRLSEVGGNLVATMRVNLLMHHFVLAAVQCLSLCVSCCTVPVTWPRASWKILHAALQDIVRIK